MSFILVYLAAPLAYLDLPAPPYQLSSLASISVHSRARRIASLKAGSAPDSPLANRHFKSANMIPSAK